MTDQNNPNKIEFKEGEHRFCDKCGDELELLFLKDGFCILCGKPIKFFQVRCPRFRGGVFATLIGDSEHHRCDLFSEDHKCVVANIDIKENA